MNGSLNYLDMVTHGGPIVTITLLILLLASVASWTIIFRKVLHLRRAQGESVQFLPGPLLSLPGSADTIVNACRVHACANGARAVGSMRQLAPLEPPGSAPSALSVSEPSQAHFNLAR